MLTRIDTPPRVDQRGTLSTIREDHSHALIRMVGEWDLATADELAELLDDQERAGRSFVRLDLSGVTFLDCVCLEVLVAAHRRLLAARGTLVLTGVPVRLARLLRITGLDDVLLATSVSDLDAHPRKPAVRSIPRPA